MAIEMKLCGVKRSKILTDAIFFASWKIIVFYETGQETFLEAKSMPKKFKFWMIFADKSSLNEILEFHDILMFCTLQMYIRIEKKATKNYPEFFNTW